MKIHSLFAGHMKNIFYVLEDESTKEAAVVDPAWDVPAIIDVIESNNLNFTKIILTHCHFDHVNGLDELLDYKQVPVYLSSNNIDKLTPKIEGLHFLEDNSVLQIGNTTINVKHSPGHSKDSLCFYSAPHLISGDTVFINGCGRCNFENSNVSDMYNSLQWVKSLPDDTIIYPGHDYARKQTDTLQNLRKTNRFLRCDTLETFVAERMN